MKIQWPVHSPFQFETCNQQLKPLTFLLTFELKLFNFFSNNLKTKLRTLLHWHFEKMIVISATFPPQFCYPFASMRQ